MLKNPPFSLVPENTKGKETNLEHSISLNSEAEAITKYQVARDRLFRPNCWHELAGSATAEFTLMSTEGIEKNNALELNEYITIDIPGPGPAAGDHFDWVRISRIMENFVDGVDESAGIQLKPCKNPFDNTKGTAHFFDESASSTLIVQREGSNLFAFYHGRNEVPNNDDVSFGDKVRNSLVAVAAIAGLSEIQWKSLIKGILE